MRPRNLLASKLKNSLGTPTRNLLLDFSEAASLLSKLKDLI
jgi:hypothetical protein